MALHMKLQHSTSELKVYHAEAASGDLLAQHTTSTAGLLVVLSGTLNFVLADAIHHLGTGQTQVIPAQIPHSVYCTSATTFLLILPQAAKIQKA
ncbi:MAG: AraC family ligand binding domain-containing protein [Bacteroidetes bacterium]|nr:AraC family ligand binding domain-containing protein [Bacteroidota bacterium]